MFAWIKHVIGQVHIANCISSLGQNSKVRRLNQLYHPWQPRPHIAAIYKPTVKVQVAAQSLLSVSFRNIQSDMAGKKGGKSQRRTSVQGGVDTSAKGKKGQSESGSGKEESSGDITHDENGDKPEVTDTEGVEDLETDVEGAKDEGEHEGEGGSERKPAEKQGAAEPETEEENGVGTQPEEGDSEKPVTAEKELQVEDLEEVKHKESNGSGVTADVAGEGEGKKGEEGKDDEPEKGEKKAENCKDGSKVMRDSATEVEQTETEVEQTATEVEQTATEVEQTDNEEGKVKPRVKKSRRSSSRKARGVSVDKSKRRKSIKGTERAPKIKQHDTTDVETGISETEGDATDTDVEKRGRKRSKVRDRKSRIKPSKPNETSKDDVEGESDKAITDGDKAGEAEGVPDVDGGATASEQVGAEKQTGEADADGEILEITKNGDGDEPDEKNEGKGVAEQDEIEQEPCKEDLDRIERDKQPGANETGAKNEEGKEDTGEKDDKEKTSLSSADSISEIEQELDAVLEAAEEEDNDSPSKPKATEGEKEESHKDSKSNETHTDSPKKPTKPSKGKAKSKSASDKKVPLGKKRLAKLTKQKAGLALPSGDEGAKSDVPGEKGVDGEDKVLEGEHKVGKGGEKNKCAKVEEISKDSEQNEDGKGADEEDKGDETDINDDIAQMEAEAANDDDFLEEDLPSEEITEDTDFEAKSLKELLLIGNQLRADLQYAMISLHQKMSKDIKTDDTDRVTVISKICLLERALCQATDKYKEMGTANPPEIQGVIAKNEKLSGDLVELQKKYDEMEKHTRILEAKDMSIDGRIKEIFHLEMEKDRQIEDLDVYIKNAAKKVKTLEKQNSRLSRISGPDPLQSDAESLLNTKTCEEAATGAEAESPNKKSKTCIVM